MQTAKKLTNVVLLPLDLRGQVSEERGALRGISRSSFLGTDLVDSHLVNVLASGDQH